MRLSERLGYTRRLVIGFVVMGGGLTIMLGLLSWRFIAMQEDLDRQRLQQRLESASDGIVASVESAIAQSERWLDEFVVADDEALDRLAIEAGSLSAGAIVVTFAGDSLDAYPSSRLLYYPAITHPNADTARLADVDALEFGERDAAGAADLLRELVQSTDPSLRAAALLRLGRIQRQQGEHEAALASYAALAELEEAWVEDVPAPLWAAINRCELLENMDRRTELRAAATDLLSALHSGRWHLSRDVYGFYSDWAATWVKTPDADVARVTELEALAAAVDAIWRGRANDNAVHAPNGADGPSIVWAKGRPFAVLHSDNGPDGAVLIAGQQFVTERWLAPSASAHEGLVLELVDVATGRSFYGGSSEYRGSSGPASAAVNGSGERRLVAVRTPAQTSLPWSLHVTVGDQATAMAGMARWRGVFLTGLALVTCLLLTSVYFISRAVSREFEVAGLQRDFVAAVSHELRSPLTSMRHMLELLTDGRVPDTHARDRFYAVLQREAMRLQRLIEQLLDFRRLDEGTMSLEMRPIETRAWIDDVVAEFRAAAAAHGHDLEVDVDGTLPPITGDRDALSRALWNLLDNAVRYSPDYSIVWLDVAPTDHAIVIEVRDRGIGIPKDEHSAIFRKFVRGKIAQRLGARGAGLGLGLSMVDEIVKAHGGELTLESTPGEGSTFTMTLPSMP